MKELSLQLYSVNRLTREDFRGTLRSVGKMGYTGVEFAGYGDIPAKEMKSLLDECGLKSVGSHVSYDKLKNILDQELEYNHILGTKYIVLPSAPINSYDNAKRVAEEVAPIAEKITKEGFVFGYHNHSNEFFIDQGEYPLDTFYANTDPAYVKAELDVYWLQNANVDPISYIQKFKDRLPILHLKQMETLENKKNCNAGDGCIDFKKIIEISSTSLGTLEYVYEQEGSDDQMDAAAKSAAYLLSL